MGFALALLVISIGAAAAIQAASDPRITRAFAGGTLRAIGLYLAFLAVPLLFLLFAGALLPPVPREAAAAGTVMAVLGWFGLALLLLIRTAPRLRRVPDFWLRFGVVDAALLALVGAGVARIAGLW
ncbi:hypothetical protein ACLF3G_22440 [Falsiroseomonas sp. HC035]|uniref:hypothetical protein n=1 Tax=Falsiroseomonas sp. HC035 TaxID=3390999 RepID=UPI003D3174B0